MIPGGTCGSPTRVCHTVLRSGVEHGMSSQERETPLCWAKAKTFVTPRHDCKHELTGHAWQLALCNRNCALSTSQLEFPH